MSGEHDLIPVADSPTAALIVVPATGTPVLPDPTPAPRALAELLAEVISRGRSENTRRAYASDLTDFFTYLLGPEADVKIPVSGSAAEHDAALHAWATPLLYRLTRAQESDINAYIAFLTPGPNKEGLAAATIARRLTPLRLLFARLHRHRMMALNPMEDVRAPRVSQRSTTVYLSRHQARHLEDACEGKTLRDLRDKALICLMIRTGLRSTEACSLQLTDMTSLDGHTIAWITGKGGERERIKIPPIAMRAIRAYLTEAGVADGAVFRRLRRSNTSPSGYTAHAQLSYDGLKFILEERFTRAGLQLINGDDAGDTTASSTASSEHAQGARRRRGPTPHSLRHTFVTLALKGGASLPEVQAAARHRDPKTTTRYAHDMDNLDNNAVDKVSY
ncbi:MAG: tyrosine-type recombinase/integrase [Chloroflexales bacterium]|nr:tyrosine-type recombinase/integrase [Chloroflexales bacterium]